MTTCIYCGGQTPDGSKFCELCGAALPVEAPVDQMFTPETVVSESIPAAVTEAQSYWQGDISQQVSQDAQQPYGQSGQQPYSGQSQQPYGAQGQQPYGAQGQQPYTQAQPMSSAPVAQPAADTGNIGWAILGAIFPIVGIILFFVWRTTKPQTAKVAIIGAAIGFALNLMFMLLD